MAEEMVDVLDEFGGKTGRQMRKSEAHTNGIWHSGAHVWIYNSTGEILLQLRGADKEIYPGTYDISAAGHLTAGDSPLDAALRETEEELGLKLAGKDLRFIGVNRTDQPIPPKGWMHRVFDWNFIACVDVAVEDLKLQASELDGAVWKPLDEFEEDVHDPERYKKYSPRPLYLYDMAIYEIRKALAGKPSANNPK